MDMLLMAVVPYLLYVFVDMKFGMKAGIGVALASVAFFAVYVFMKSGHFDLLFLVDGGLLLGAGYLSIKLRNSKWFKLQPTIVNAIFCVYIGYLQIFDMPILVRYLPMMKAMAGQLPPIFESEGGLLYLGKMSRDLIGLLVIHGTLNAYAALKLRNMLWLLARVSILPLLLLYSVLIAPLLYRHLLVGL